MAQQSSLWNFNKGDIFFDKIDGGELVCFDSMSFLPVLLTMYHNCFDLRIQMIEELGGVKGPHSYSYDI
jgi:hypothetical protein